MFGHFTALCMEDKKLIYMSKDTRLIYFNFVNLTICMNRVVFRIRTHFSGVFSMLHFGCLGQHQGGIRPAISHKQFGFVAWGYVPGSQAL